MRIDPEDLRRHYESLSDEGFLDIDRSDLAPVAQGIYDQEIARRGLDHPPEQEMEAFHRPLPIFKVGADRDIASELRADTTQAHRPPGWKTPPAPGPPTFTQMAIIWSPEQKFRPLCGRRGFRIALWSSLRTRSRLPRRTGRTACIALWFRENAARTPAAWSSGRFSTEWPKLSGGANCRRSRTKN